MRHVHKALGYQWAPGPYILALFGELGLRDWQHVAVYVLVSVDANNTCIHTYPVLADQKLTKFYITHFSSQRKLSLSFFLIR